MTMPSWPWPFWLIEPSYSQFITEPSKTTLRLPLPIADAASAFARDTCLYDWWGSSHKHCGIQLLAGQGPPAPGPLLPGDGMATVWLPPSQKLLAHDGHPGIKHWLTRYGPSP